MIDALTVGALSVAVIFVLILLGFHIGVALAAVSFVGVYLMTGKIMVAASLLQTTAFHGVNDYIFAVIPLFVVMGLFATESGATRDLFDAAESLMRRMRGGIGIATVIANAIFAAITGVSVASAAVFSKLAIPEMNRLGYERKFALGIVASSALLGMLIPPSILMIIYGVITCRSGPGRRRRALGHDTPARAPESGARRARRAGRRGRDPPPAGDRQDLADRRAHRAARARAGDVR